MYFVNGMNIVLLHNILLVAFFSVCGKIYWVDDWIYAHNGTNMIGFIFLWLVLQNYAALSYSDIFWNVWNIFFRHE